MKKFIVGNILGLALGIGLGSLIFSPSSHETYGDKNIASEKSLKPKEKQGIQSLSQKKLENKNSLSSSGKDLFKKKLNKSRDKKEINEELSRAHEASVEEAYEIYQGLYSRHPNSKIVLQQFSNYLVMNDLWDEAFPVLEKCSKAFPRAELCQGNLVMYYEKKGNKNDEEEAIESCLKKDPGNMMCLNAYANFALRYGNFSQALKMFSEMALRNGDGEITFETRLINWGKALAHRGLNNRTKTEEYFTLSCQENFEPACSELSKF